MFKLKDFLQKLRRKKKEQKNNPPQNQQKEQQKEQPKDNTPPAGSGEEKHDWDQPKAYAVALLLIIGILATPMYTGFVSKDVQPAAVLKDSCTDTDGRSYAAKGMVIAVSSGSLVTLEDSCSADILKEYFCNDLRPVSVFTKCQNGCSNGRCLP